MRRPQWSRRYDGDSQGCQANYRPCDERPATPGGLSCLNWRNPTISATRDGLVVFRIARVIAQRFPERIDGHRQRIVRDIWDAPDLGDQLSLRYDLAGASCQTYEHVHHTRLDMDLLGTTHEH